MDLSVIIVNYNVRYFLEQCLHSVLKASEKLQVEVFVVDNNSSDGSVAMVQEKFPTVHVIDNKDNLGFSKANNQAIKLSKGKYVLLLNPDTIVEEQTFDKCVAFLNEHPLGGGLGVKMIDGKGNFLPESKRGLPTPATAFYKVFGLAALFPKSKQFNRYHLGYLSNEENHEIEVLSGAFMMLRKEVLDKIGLLDESFFMYGEDIDLSYRIIKAGYKNYYFSETKIIHYKGESTKKQSINYVLVFYKAMIIFTKKHFSSNSTPFFIFFINIAVYLRAFVAILNRLFKKSFILVLDCIFLLLGLYCLKSFSQGWTHIKYPTDLSNLAVFVYSFIWILTNLFAGVYDYPMKLLRSLKSVAIGAIIILLLYSLVPEVYRFSRAYILLGFLYFFIYTFLSRITLDQLNIKEFKLYHEKKRRVAIIGDEKEVKKVSELLESSLFNKPEYIANVNSEKDIPTKNSYFVGDIDKLPFIIDSFSINEIIYCSANLSSRKIIESMIEVSNENLEQKIAHIEENFIIGSNNIQELQDIKMLNIESIQFHQYKRNSRAVDLFISFLMLITLPIHLLFITKPGRFMHNLFLVLVLNKTWVGFLSTAPLKKLHFLDPVINLIESNKHEQVKTMECIEYIQTYSIGKHLGLIVNYYKELGR